MSESKRNNVFSIKGGPVPEPPMEVIDNTTVDLEALAIELAEAGFQPVISEVKKYGSYLSFQPYPGTDMDVWEDGTVQLGNLTIPLDVLYRIRRFLPESVT